MYDTKRKRWDTSMCQNAAATKTEEDSTNSSKKTKQRCAKMDCHLSVRGLFTVILYFVYVFVYVILFWSFVL